MEKKSLIKTVKEIVDANGTLGEMKLEGDRTLQLDSGKLNYVTSKLKTPEDKLKKYTIANILIEIGDKKVRQKLTHPITMSA